MGRVGRSILGNGLFDRRTPLAERSHLFDRTFHLFCASLETAVMPNESVGRTVVFEWWGTIAHKLWDNALGQGLAELDAPLIE